MSARLTGVRVDTRHLELDLEVEEGRCVAVVGPNGSGKSSLLALLSGLLAPDGGEVEISGSPVAGSRWVPPHRRRVGLLTQDPTLFPHLNVLDNVAFGPRAQGISRADARARAERRLAGFDVSHLAARRPRELSGGQAQRVALARALAGDPAVLLLDEPFSALDVEAATDVRALMRRTLRDWGTTTVVVTHDLLDVLALASEVVVLDAGKVVDHRATVDLLNTPPTAFVAALAGVNLVPGELAGDTLTLGGHVVVGLPEDVTAHGPGAAVFPPAAVAVHRSWPGEGSPRNHLDAEVVAVEAQGGLVRVVCVLRGMEHRVSADITAAAAAELGLMPGDDVVLVVKAAEVRLHPR